MNKVLARANAIIRRSASTELAKPCAEYRRDGFLHVSIESKGCRYRDAGYCTMCDYGCGNPASAEETVRHMQGFWESSREPISELLVGSCGSVFDPDETPDGVLDSVLRFIAAHPTPTVIFETHYATVSPDVLERVKKALAGSATDIVIEMGLESADPFVLENSLNKYMDLPSLRDKMTLIKSFGMSVVLNVFLGAPFLTPAMQLADAERAVLWSFDNGADGAVVFPANIKPGTLIGYLHERGRYGRLPAWLLVELLNRLPDAAVGAMELAWYGDRQKLGMALSALPPRCCDECDGLLQAFFGRFNALRGDAGARRKLIDGLMQSSGKCDCHADMKSSLERPAMPGAPAGPGAPAEPAGPGAPGSPEASMEALVFRALRLLEQELGLADGVPQ